LEARITGYERELKRATQVANREARSIEGRFNRMNDTLARQFAAGASRINGILGTIGAGVSLGALTNLARSALQLADDLQDTAEQLGITTDALQVYRFAAAETGVEAGKMDQAIQRLNTTIGEAASGEEEAQKKFKGLGIAFTDAEGKARSAESVLADLADLIAALPTPAERAAAAAELLGERAGPKLVPLLSQGAEGLRKYGEQARTAFQVMSKETIDELARAQREIEKFTMGLTIAAGGFIGFMNDMERASRQGGAELKLGRVTREVERLSHALATLPENVSPERRAELAAELAAARAEQRKLQDFIGLSRPQAHSGRGIRFAPPPKTKTIDLGGGTEKAGDVLADLQAERDALTQTNRERFIAAALKRADADATSALGQRVAALAGQLYDETKAFEVRAEAMKRAAEAAAQQDDDRAAAFEAGRELIRTRQELDRSLEEELAGREELARIAGLSLRDQEIETILLDEINAARAAGLPLLDEEIAKKRELITASVDREIAIRKENGTLEEGFEASRSAAKGFLTDLAQGEDTVLSFTNALSRLSDRLLDMSLDGIFDALSNIGSGESGGAGPGAGPGSEAAGGSSWLDSIFGAIGTIFGSVNHSGGAAGRSRSGRMVPAAAFIGAPQLHNGNLPGLRSDEVAAILQKGEPVISLPQLRRARQDMARDAGARRNGDATVIMNLPPAPNGFGYSPAQLASRAAEGIVRTQGQF
jgi:hypothetical protein